jgi:hypothetical protein
MVMKTMMGAMGWITVVVLAGSLGACDDTKATCEKMCNKMGECMPAQVDEAMKSLPAGAEGMKDEMKKKMEESFKKAVDECKSKCGEDGKEISESEKKKIEKAKECLDKDCNEFVTCIEKI